MTVELLKGTLAWSAVFNMGILLWWFLFLSLAQRLGLQDAQQVLPCSERAI